MQGCYFYGILIHLCTSGKQITGYGGTQRLPQLVAKGLTTQSERTKKWRPEPTLKKRGVFRKALRVGKILNSNKMKKVMTLFGVILFASTILTSCGGGPDACECVKQYEYWSQDGGLYKLDQNLINRCTDYYKDADAYSYPEDLNSAKRNAQKKC